MTKELLKSYIGKYVKFDIAIMPPSWKTISMDCDNHLEGILIENNGRLSHFAIGECAIRDDMIPLIINFETKEDNNDA